MPNPLSNDTDLGSDKEHGKEDVIELLGEDDKEETLDLTPEKGKERESKGDASESEEEEKEEEVDELKEIEEELEGPKDEDLELTTPVRRKEILAKYPKLFKDFPYLEKAYYREQQFTEVFPTIQDAKASAEKAQILDTVERDLMSGNITNVLTASKQHNNAESFHKIVDNYLPALRQVDQQAYYHVLGNVIKDTIITMVREGRSLGEQGAPLQAAANVLNQFIFGSQTFQPPTQLSQERPEDNKREQEIQERERQRTFQTFESVKDDLQNRADNVLKSTIDQHIDPKSTMTSYVKTHATKEAFETLEDLMSKDTRFRGLLDKLWEKAFEQSFDKPSTDRIKSAYLSKAKTLLPSVIKRARNDALKGLGKRADTDTEEEEKSEPDKRGPIQPGRSTPPSSGKFKKGSDIPKSMSTLDVLMQD